MAKDGEFVKIKNGYVNKLLIGNQEISVPSDKLLMSNVNISNAEIKNLSVKGDDLNPGPVGEKGDIGLLDGE